MKNISNAKYHDLFSTKDLRSDINRRSLRGGAAVMGAELGSALLRIGSMAILARLLLPEDFGLLAMVTAFTVFAERFKDLGLGDATVQTRDINHEQVSALFWINLAICMGIALLLAFLSGTIAWFYSEPRLTAVTLVLASTFLFSGLVIQHQALLKRQLRFGALAFVQLISIVLSLLIAIILAYYGFGYWALVAREFSRAVFVVIGTWLACPWRPGFPGRETKLEPFLSFGKNVTGFNLVYFFSRSIDKILLGRLYGPVWVGLYTNAYALISLPVSQIQYPVNTVALPALSALQREPSEYQDYFEKMIQLLSFISMPVVLFLALFADVVVNILLGSNWMNAVPIFQALAFGAFVEPIVHAVGPAMVAGGKTKEYFRLGMINASLLILCLIGGSFAGAIGIAIGYSVAVYLSLAACFGYGLRETSINIIPIVRKVMVCCFISILTASVMLGVRYAIGWDILPQWLLLFVIGGAIIYLGLWSFVPGGRQMMRQYWNYARHAVSSIK